MSDKTNIQFKGLVRFSYIAARPKAAKDIGVDPAIRARVFSPDHMDVQFALFDYFTLPSLRRQTDQGFSAVVLTSDAAPEQVLDRLLGLIEKLDNVSLLALPPLQLSTAGARSFRQIETDASATHIATFRLDEGAALEDGAIARLRTLAKAKISLDGPDRSFVLSFNKGFMLNLGAQDGAPRLHDYATRTLQPNGLTCVCPVSEKTHVFGHGLPRMPQHFDTWTDATVPRFLTAQMEFDSSAEGATPSDPSGAAHILRTRFGLSYNDIESG